MPQRQPLDISSDPDFQSLGVEDRLDVLIQGGFSDSDIDLIMSGKGGKSPRMEPPESLKMEHQENLGQERRAFKKAQDVGTLGSRLATGTRVVTGMLSNIPLAGAVFGGGGEILARGMEYASGAREAPSLGAAIRESALPVAAQAGLGAIPGGVAANAVRKGGEALRYAAPATSRVLRGTRIPAAIGGAVHGAGNVAVTELAEGQMPTMESIGLGATIGGGLGGALATRSAGHKGLREKAELNPNRVAVKRTETGLNRLTKALAIPKTEAEGYIRKMRPAMSEIYAHRGTKDWNTMEDFAQAAQDTADDYYQKNYESISQAFQNARATGNAVAAQILKLTKGIRPTQDQGYRQSLLNAVRAYRGRTFSLGELESYRKTLNDELDAIQKQSGGRMADIINANPEARIKDAELRGIRETINRAMDNYAHLQEGETAGTLRNFSAIKDLAERARERSSAVNLENMERAGERWSIERGVDSALRAVGLRQANPAAAAGSTAFSIVGRGLNHPDVLVKSAKRILDNYALDPSKGAGYHKVLATPLPLRTRPWEGDVEPPLPGTGGGGGGGRPSGRPQLGEGPPIEGQIITPKRIGGQVGIEAAPPTQFIGAGVPRLPGPVQPQLTASPLPVQMQRLLGPAPEPPVVVGTGGGPLPPRPPMAPEGQPVEVSPPAPSEPIYTPLPGSSRLDPEVIAASRQQAAEQGTVVSEKRWQQRQGGQEPAKSFTEMSRAEWNEVYRAKESYKGLPKGADSIDALDADIAATGLPPGKRTYEDVMKWRDKVNPPPAQPSPYGTTPPPGPVPMQPLPTPAKLDTPPAEADTLEKSAHAFVFQPREKLERKLKTSTDLNLLRRAAEISRAERLNQKAIWIERRIAELEKAPPEPAKAKTPKVAKPKPVKATAPTAPVTAPTGEPIKATTTKNAVNITVDTPKVKTTLKEQKSYLLAEIDKAFDEAPKLREIPNMGGGYKPKVNIKVPGDGEFSVHNSEEQLSEFKKRVSSQWPTNEGPKKPPSIRATTNKRLTGEGVEYYNPYRTRKQDLIPGEVDARAGKNINKNYTHEGWYSNGHYAILSDPPKGITPEPLPAIGKIVEMPSGLAPAKIQGEFYYSPAPVKEEPRASYQPGYKPADEPKPKPAPEADDIDDNWMKHPMAHVTSTGQPDRVIDPQYADAVLTKYPNAQPFVTKDEKGFVYFMEKGKVVAVIAPIAGKMKPPSRLKQRIKEVSEGLTPE